MITRREEQMDNTYDYMEDCDYDELNASLDEFFDALISTRAPKDFVENLVTSARDIEQTRED